MKQTKLIYLALLGLFLIPVLVNGQLSTTATTKGTMIEISPNQVIESKTCPEGCPLNMTTMECSCPPKDKKICPEGCFLNMTTMKCVCPPVEKSWTGILKKCTLPAVVEAWSCGKCYNFTLVLSDGKELTFNDKKFSNLEEFVNKTVKLTGYENKVVLMMCPIQITATNIELAGAIFCPEGCFLNMTTMKCFCPPEQKAETCPTGCVCSGNTTTCQTKEIKPIEVKISSESGIQTVSVEKVPNGLSIKSGETTAITTEKLVIEGNKLSLKTSTGNKEIKILPEEASSRATAVTSINTIELKEESQQPVYSVKGTKQAKLLFVIPVSMQIETKVSAESGNVISVKKPWWSFLAR